MKKLIPFILLFAACDCPKCPEPIIPDTIYVDTFYYARIDSAKEVAIKEATAFRDSIRSEFILWVDKMRGTMIYNNTVVSTDSMQQILCN